MKDLILTKRKYYKALKLVLITISLLSSKADAKNIYIDPQVKGFPTVSERNPEVIQLISHGRPGELLLDGQWRNADEIVSFIKANHLISGQEKALNIYGCEFAKGTKGLLAVAIIEKELGIRVAASTNITGKHGDWILEVGNIRNYDVLKVTNYAYDLQTICRDTTYTSVNTGWTTAPASPAYSPPAGCSGTNSGSTTNADISTDRGFDTWYDNPSGYFWSRTLSGLNVTKAYRVYINMYSYSNATDKRDSYFQGYNLGGQTGNFTCHGNTNTVDQTIYDFIVTNKTSLSFSGTIVASNWDQCEQAVNYRVQIMVQEVASAISYSPPALTSSTASNVCPALTTDLTGKATGCGSGSAIEWHTTNTGYSNSTKLANITSVADGTYYAICHNTTKACYSSPSLAMTVTNVVCSPLSIDFKSTNAIWKNNDAAIIWTVGREENNNYFSIERSLDGKNFKEIAQVKSIGNHQDDQEYSFIDVNARLLSTDKVFYRIKQIDVNSNPTTSTIMMLSVSDLRSAAYIYPNPIASGNFDFVYQNNLLTNTSLNVQIVDAYGRSLYQTSKKITGGKNIIPISIEGMSAGIYFLKYSNKQNNIDGVIRIAKK